MEKNIAETLLWGEQELRHVSESARLDSEILLAHVLGIKKIDLILSEERSVRQEDQNLFRKMIERRKKQEPVAYLTGTKEFWGLDFSVTPDVLIPRPETEHLVEHAMGFLTRLEQKVKVLELGTGSGAVIIALAYELLKLNKPVELHATDISNEALSVARNNANKLVSAARVHFFQSNWFEQVEQRDYDLIISNPPYVEEASEKVSPSVHFEPAERSVYSGKEGLNDLKLILADANSYLSRRAALMLEMGFDQRPAVEKLIKKSFAKKWVGYQSSFYNDYSGKNRGVILTPGQ